ncbi:MAG: hypothetical protein AAF823_09190 [Planctomycetota bacterium]
MGIEPWLWYSLENPWPMAVVAVFVGLGVRQACAARGQRVGMRASWLVGLAAAVGLVLAARGVTTPREALMERTRALVMAAGGATEGGAASVDVAALEAMVDADARIVGPGGEAWAAFHLIARRLPTIVQSQGVEGQEVRGIDAVVDRSEAVSVVRVATPLSGGLPTIRTDWRLAWRYDIAEGAWVVEELRLLRVNGQAPVRGMMP